MLSRETTGRLQVVASAVGYGFIGVFAKRAYEAGLEPGELLTLRFGIAAAILWGYALVVRRGVPRVSARMLAVFGLLGLFGYALFTTLYFHALTGLSASLTALLLYTFPVIVTLGARALFGERIGPKRAIALPVVTVGLVLLLWGEMHVTNWVYVALGLGSAVFYSGYILSSSRMIRAVDGLVAGVFITTAAALSLAVVAVPPAAKLASLGTEAWISVLGLAILSTVGPVILFLKGLEKLTSAEVSILSLVEPITAVVFAALLLGERLAPVQIAGGVIILAALAFSSFRGSRWNQQGSSQNRAR